MRSSHMHGNWQIADYRPAKTQAAQAQGAVMAKSSMVHSGLTITIERQAGRNHKWQARDGTSGTTKQLFDYGYIDGTCGADGEEYDVFVGPKKTATTVYIAHQNQAGSGRYDEDKAMLGFSSEAEARAAYIASYGGDHTKLRNMTQMPIDAFKRMLRNMKKSVPTGQLLFKAIAKYIKREGTPGNYKYTYAEQPGKTKSGKKVSLGTANRSAQFSAEEHLDAMRHHQAQNAMLVDKITAMRRMPTADHEARMAVATAAAQAHGKESNYHWQQHNALITLAAKRAPARVSVAVESAPARVASAAETTPLRGGNASVAHVSSVDMQPSISHPAYRDIRGAADDMSRVERLKYDDPESVVDGVNETYARSARKVQQAFAHATPDQHKAIAEHHDRKSQDVLARPPVFRGNMEDHSQNALDFEHHKGIAMVHRFLASKPSAKAEFRPYEPSNYRQDDDDGGWDDEFRRSRINPNGDEKDSAAAIRGAEIARRLKEKLDQAKGKNMNKSQLLIKAGMGEGSRGGKIIGHTSTGKPVYQDHSKNKGGFSRGEHKEAADLHQNEYKFHAKQSSENAYAAHHSGRTVAARQAKQLEEHHEEQAKKHQDAVDYHHNAMHVTKSLRLMPCSNIRSLVEEDLRKAASGDGSRGMSSSRKKSLQGNTNMNKAQDLSNADLCSMMIKSGSGAGSRGGRVIGHTKSGKAIYAGSSKGIESYSKHDHVDAAHAHAKEANGLALDIKNAPADKKDEIRGDMNHHNKLAEQHASYGRRLKKASSMNKADTVDVGGDPLAFLGMKTVDLSENGGNGGAYSTTNPGAPNTANSNATVGDAPAVPVQALSADDLTNVYLQSGSIETGLTAAGTYAAPPSTQYVNNDVPLVDPLNIPTVVLSAEAKDPNGMNAVLNQNANSVMKSHFWADGGDAVVPEADYYQADVICKGATTLSSQVLCKSCGTQRAAMINSCSNCGEGVVFSKSYLDSYLANCAAPQPEPSATMVDASQGLNLADWE